MKLLLSSFSLLITGSLLAQTGVAGVGNSTNCVMWLDAHAMQLTNNAPVANFTDFSGNGNNFSQGTSTKQPIYNTGVVNGMPVLTFDGTDDFMESSSVSALESNNLTYFIAYQRTNLKSQMMINAKYSSQSPAKWRLYNNTGSNNVIGAQFSPTIKYVTALDDGDVTFMSHHMTPSDIRIFREGTQTQTKAQGYTAPTGHQKVEIGGVFPSANNYYLQGFIGEVVIYNTALNDLERVLIENYLGTKYGISPATDLYSHETTHMVEFIAIGNDGTNSQSTAQGKGILEFSNPSAMGANEYLCAAHTDNPLTDFTFADVPASLVGHQRFTRTWRVDETGDVGNVTLTFDLGANDFANSTTYNLLIDSDGDFSNATIVPLSYAGGSVSATVNLSAGDFITVSGLEEILEIHAINTGVWSNTVTWDCGCIPGANDEVYIDPFVSVTMDQDGDVGFFSIDTDGKLIQNAGFTLNVRQDMEIFGTLEATDGTIAMVGSIAQYFDGGGQTITLDNFTINNSTSQPITMGTGSTYLLNGLLSPTQGSLELEDANANFVVNSTSATTGGRIGEVVAPFTFTGDFTVRRFIAAGNADWRNLASPVNGATFDDWDPDLAMSGPNFPDGCAFGVDCFNSVVYWEKGLTYDVNNSTDAIENMRGYEVFVGDDLNTFSGTTLNSTGTLNTSADLVKTLTGGGWWTIGNPYASPIEFKNITKTSQVGDYFYVFDATTSSYQWYDNSGAGSTSLPAEITTDGRIAIGQAVWINTIGPSSMTFRQSDKITADATFIRGQVKYDGDMRLTLSEDGTTFSTTIAIAEAMGATDGRDSLIDIKDLQLPHAQAPGFSFAFPEGNVRKNFISTDYKDKVFNLTMLIHNDGYHHITAENVSAFDNYQKVLIFDKEANEFYDLRDAESFIFYSQAGEIDRFQLILSNTLEGGEAALGGGSEDLNNVTVVQMGNYVEVKSEITEVVEGTEVYLFNVLGQEKVFYEVIDLLPGSNMVALPNGLKGIHVLTINMNGEQITKKLVF